MSAQELNHAVVPAPAFVAKAGTDRKGRTFRISGEQAAIRIATRDTNGAFCVAENQIAPTSGPPLHRHFLQDEWWYVLEGQFVFEVNGERLDAGPGDTVSAAKGSVHRFQNIAESAGRMVVTVVPGGLDDFFEELSAALPPGASIDPALVAEVFSKHGLEYLGPPLGAQ